MKSVLSRFRHLAVMKFQHRGRIIVPMTEPDIVCERLGVTPRSLRIAFVTETWPPEVNGVAITAARFAEGLRARHHDIHLVRPRQGHEAAGDEPPQMLARGVGIPGYPGLRMGLPAHRRLSHLWSLHRPDVVHIVTEGPLGWSALRTALRLRLPVTSDFRTHFDAYSNHYGIGWLRRPIARYLRKFHNRTQYTLVPTRALAAELAAGGYRNLEVVGRGVDTALFHPGRRSAALRAVWGVAPDDPVFAYVGRLAPEKNLDLLFDAFRRVRRAAPQARLLLVDDGPATLPSGAADSVLRVGVKRGAELAAHYASADAFLFPSLTETFGNVTLEAIASGLPVVAFAYGAAGEVLTHEVTGLLAPYGDDAQFGAHAVALACDPAQRARLAAQVHTLAPALAWDHAIDRFESLLIAAAEGGRPRPGHRATVAGPHVTVSADAGITA